MLIPILVIVITLTAVVLLLSGALIIWKKEVDERNNSKPNIRVNQEREKFKRSSKATKNKAPDKDKFRGVTKKKKKFKSVNNRHGATKKENKGE